MRIIIVISVVIILAYVVWYFFVRIPNVEFTNLDKKNKILKFKVNGKEYTYDWGKGMGMSFQSRGIDFSVEPPTKYNPQIWVRMTKNGKLVSTPNIIIE